MRKINVDLLITKIRRKNLFSGFSTMVLNSLKIQEKGSKFFLAGYPCTKSPFLGPKMFSNFFWLQLVPGTTIKKNEKNIGSTWY
jgi:hypothetical protein